MAVYVPPVGQVRAVVPCRGMVYPNHTARAVVLAGRRVIRPPCTQRGGDAGRGSTMRRHFNLKTRDGWSNLLHMFWWLARKPLLHRWRATGHALQYCLYDTWHIGQNV